MEKIIYPAGSTSPVGIIDSGVGGLTVLREMDRCEPVRSVIYFGDTVRMPYGNRKAEEIITGANAMIAFLESAGVSAVLLACNTISSYISELKSNVPLISIITAAAECVKALPEKDEIGVIATVATVESGSYKREINRLLPDTKVITGSSIMLPKIIDSNIEDKKLLCEKISECLDPIFDISPKLKNVILGCSHFPIVIDQIRELYPDVNFIDPAHMQVAMLNKIMPLKENPCERTIRVYTTAQTYEFAAAIKRLNLEVDSLIKVKLFPCD